MTLLAGARIVVVDDNSSGRYVTAHILTRAGCTVLEAGTGAQALELAAAGADLMVLDVNLPDMTGFAVCQQLKAQPDTATLPVLMVSASYLTAENTVYGLDIGADAYLPRPTEPEVLLATVRALLRVRAAEAEVRQINQTLEQRVLERTAQLQRLNAELTLTNEELEAFTSSVSHDLRTPARHVTGFSELTRRAIQARQLEQASAHLLVVERAAARMHTLIDGLLHLSRTTHRELAHSPVNLQLLLNAALDDLTGELRGRQVTFDLAALPMVPGDHDSLQQVMTNLLSNAVKFTRTRPEAVIAVWADEDQEQVTVSVRDNGVGFNAQYQSRLFGLFQRLHTEHEFEGTGIGLAIVQRVIARHHGTVTASSQSGQGATFAFSLPKAARPPGPEHNAGA